MTSNRQTSAHNREIDEELSAFERNLFWDPVAADHSDRYPEPATVNGHIPDIVVEGPLGQRKLIEVEHRGDDTKRTREQHTAFEQAAIYDPMTEFEVEYVDDGEKDESRGGLFGLF